MIAAEATLQSSADESKTRLVKFEEQVREARDKLKASESERELLAVRLAQALREKEVMKKEIEDRSTKEKVGSLSLCTLENFHLRGVLLPCVSAAGLPSLPFRTVISFRSI